MSHFVSKEEIRHYNLKGIDIDLIMNEKVFPPSEQGIFFCKNISISSSETVLDIGTGTGLFGIIAAKLGGIIFATDCDIDAIDIAKKNAKNNNVTIDFRLGEYFADYDKFDVIIANIPSEVIPKAYRKKIGDKLANTIDGGFDGLKYWKKVVELAPLHLKKHGRLYLTITGMADYNKAYNIIDNNEFNVKIINSANMSVKDFFYNYRDFYSREPYKKFINIKEINGKIVTKQDILELRLR